MSGYADRALAELKKLPWNLRLCRRVAEVLMAQPDESFRKLSIEARGGVVMLYGILRSKEQRDEVVQLVNSIAGVERVLDLLTVRERANRTAMQVSLVTEMPQDSLWERLLPRLAQVATIALLITGAYWGLRSTSKPGVAIVPVTGAVFVDGQPVGGAEVVLYPVDAAGPDPLRPRGVVEADGRFLVTTFEEKDGAPAGRYIVTIRIAPEAAAAVGAKSEVWARLAHPRTSPLTADVPQSEAGVELPAFQLASGKSPERKPM